MHWRKVAGRPMCVGFPCALLAYQGKALVKNLAGLIMQSFFA